MTYILYVLEYRYRVNGVYCSEGKEVDLKLILEKGKFSFSKGQPTMIDQKRFLTESFFVLCLNGIKK